MSQESVGENMPSAKLSMAIGLATMAALVAGLCCVASTDARCPVTWQSVSDMGQATALAPGPGESARASARARGSCLENPDSGDYYDHLPPGMQ